MSELGDIWRAVRNASKDSRASRLLRATEEFPVAHAVAHSAGMNLRQCTEAHYQLSALNGSWQINLFPSTFRVIVKESKTAPFAPRIALSYNEEWTLLDLVQKLTEGVLLLECLKCLRGAESHGIEIQASDGVKLSDKIESVLAMVEPAPSTPEPITSTNVLTGEKTQWEFASPQLREQFVKDALETSACPAGILDGDKDLQTSESRIANSVTPQPSQLASTPEPFKPGDLVVCVDNTDRELPLVCSMGVPYEVSDLVGHDRIGLVGFDGFAFQCRRFRHATAAEIEAHKAKSEVPPPASEPQPAKYRPFASAAEFKPHRDRWMRISGNDDYLRIIGYDSAGVSFVNDWVGWNDLFDVWQFDTSEPCGVRE